MNATDRYVERLIEDGSAIALPRLRATCLPDALYHVRDRGGLGAVAIPETALDEHQLDALARFRFAQYMASGYVDQDVAFRERLDRCPLATYTSPHTVHFVVFAAATGELLASMCMVGPPPAAAGVRVATRNRPLLPVEEQFGWGPFNRLERRPGHPDRATARVRTARQEPPPPGCRAARGHRAHPGADAPGDRTVGHRLRRGGRPARAVARAAQSRVLPYPARGAAGRPAVLRAGASAQPRARATRPLSVRVRGRGPRRHRVTPRCDRGGTRAARLASAFRAPRAEADPLGGAELAAAGERAPRPGRHPACAARDVDRRAPAYTRARRAPGALPRVHGSVRHGAHDAGHLRESERTSRRAPRSSVAARSPASSS